MARARKKKAASRRKARKPANDDAADGLSTRPAWSGQLKLSLVSCPVALYRATTRAQDISFHLINPKTHNRIRMVPTDPDSGAVDRGDLVKGYEISKDHYVLITDEELRDVRLETTNTLDIEHFVDEAGIDRLYWDEPYFLVPDGDEGIEAYIVIREAMNKAGRVALGRVVMHTRERLMAIEVRGKGLLAWTLRMADEVLDAADAFAEVPNTRPDRHMIEIAEKIIDQREAEFRPAGFKDRYEQALRELIRAKQKGKKAPVEAEPPPRGNVIDLMEALKKSAARRSGASSSHRKRAR